MSNSKAVKSGIWYTAANFLMRSIGLITTPIFTRLLTHEEFGLYSNFSSWLGILTIIITLNLESTFISARYDFEEKFDNYILSVLSLSTLSSAAAIVILNALYIPLAGILGMSRLYLNCMLIYILFLPAVNLFQARERYNFEYKISVLLSLIISIGSALLSVVLVMNMDDGLQGRIFGSVIPTIAVGVILYFIIFRNGKSVDTSYWKYALVICLPFIPHLLSMTVLNSLDRIMITNICGAEDNALYSLAYSCGHIISILLVSMNTAFAPWLGQKLHDKAYGEIRSASKKYIGLFMALAFGIMIFTPEILLIMGGRSYNGALYVMPPVACGCICQFLYTLFVNVEQFSRKTIGMAIASASAALLNYVLNLIFIPKFGYIAAAYTTLAGFLWLLLVHMLLVKKYGYSEVYSYRFVALAAGAAMAVTLGVNALYSVPVVRYIVGVIYILAVIYTANRMFDLREQFNKFVKKKISRS